MVYKRCAKSTHVPRKLLVYSKCADREQAREVAAVAGVARRAASSGKGKLELR